MTIKVKPLVWRGKFANGAGGILYVVEQDHDFAILAKVDGPGTLKSLHDTVDPETGETIRRELTDDERETFPDAVACRDATIALLDARIEQLEVERDAWIESARLHSAAEAAFLEWLREAGEHMRDVGVTIRDDGVDSGEILTAKVPECAALLKARAEAAEAKLAAFDVDVLARVEAALMRQHDWHLSQTEPVDMGGVEIVPFEAYAEGSMCEETIDALTDLRAIMGKLK